MKKKNRELRLYPTFVVGFVTFLVNLRYICDGLFSVDTTFITFGILILLASAIMCVKISLFDVLIGCLILMLIVINSSAVAALSFFMFCKLLFFTPIKLMQRVNIICMMIGNLLIILLFYTGITKDYVGIDMMRESVRHTMGFTNPNIFSLYVYASLLLMYYMMCKYWGRIFSGILILFLAYISYGYSGSRTAFGGILVLLIMDLIINVLLKNKNMPIKLFYMLPVVLVTTSFYFCIEYNSYPELNTILSGRLSFMGTILEDLNYTEWILGFDWNENIPKDNAYITILSGGGMILILIYFIFYKMYIDSLNYVGLSSLPIILSVLISGLTEYVFVGLNMISITIAIIMIEVYEKSLSYSASLQC